MKSRKLEIRQDESFLLLFPEKEKKLKLVKYFPLFIHIILVSLEKAVKST